MFEVCRINGDRMSLRWFGSQKALLLMAVVALPAGCSDKTARTTLPVAECKPAAVEVFLQAGEKMNLNQQGQSTPVEVRVLQLRERELFDQLDFESIWKGDSAELGKDLVKSTSLTVFPSKLKIYPMKLEKEVAYIALVGIFQKPVGRQWQHVVDVSTLGQSCGGADDLHTIIHAMLTGNRIIKPR